MKKILLTFHISFVFISLFLISCNNQKSTQEEKLILFYKDVERALGFDPQTLTNTNKKKLVWAKYHPDFERDRGVLDTLIKYIQKHDIKTAFAPEGLLSKKDIVYYKKRGLDCYQIDQRDSFMYKEITQKTDSASVALYNLLSAFVQEKQFAENHLRKPTVEQKKLFREYIKLNNAEKSCETYINFHNEKIVSLNQSIINFVPDSSIDYDLYLFWVGGYHAYCLKEYNYAVLWSSVFGDKSSSADISLSIGIFLNTWLGLEPFECSKIPN